MRFSAGDFNPRTGQHTHQKTWIPEATIDVSRLHGESRILSASGQESLDETIMNGSALERTSAHRALPGRVVAEGESGIQESSWLEID